jgi:co-chaperonin GroES (HSP10)
LIPKLNRVLLKAVDRSRPGDIILPDNADEEQFKTWEVVAIGDPRILENGERLPINLNIGDEVIITTKFSMVISCTSKEDPDYGCEFRICDYAGVMAVVEKRKKGQVVIATPAFAKMDA